MNYSNDVQFKWKNKINIINNNIYNINLPNLSFSNPFNNVKDQQKLSFEIFENNNIDKGVGLFILSKSSSTIEEKNKSKSLFI